MSSTPEFEVDDAWIERVATVLMGVAAGDFDLSLERSGRGDPRDVLAYLINNTIAELKRLVEQRERAARIVERRAQEQHVDRMLAVGTLAAGVAHELNTPLGFSMLNLQLIRERLPQLWGSDEGLSTIANLVDESRLGIERASAVVADLRLLSRSEEEASGPVELGALVQRATRMLAPLLRERARLQLDLEEGLYTVANEARLGQALLNLVQNAAQAIPLGAYADNEVRVLTKRQGERVVIEIRDSGCGFDADTRDRIFDAFFTTKPVGEGTGLGLPFVLKTVKACGGSIDVESELGRGSIFRLFLPRHTLKEDSQRSQTSNDRGDEAMPHVLIVDDDPQVLSAVSMGLARRAQVCAVSSVREAEAALRESRFDLILCDIMMPERTGIDLLDSLVESEPEMVMNFAFMSGGGVSATLQERLQESGVPLLLKPFGLKELREFVGSAVRDRDASSV